ncbi:MAG: sigma-54-dependent Fis family transcriptional regulator [Desulfuromonadales bacterium]|nr:sigma-54-dependent Fis family transcriptional regulator [Desulfuromonadales bacterium]
MLVKLLIIDDDQVIRDVLKGIFEDQSFEIFLAADGESGLRIIREHRPNLAIIDINLPGKSGLEILKDAKQIDSKISVIIATGYNTTQNAIEAMKFGAFDYLAKPFNILEVQEVVAKGLASNLLSRKVKFSLESSEIIGDSPDEDIMIGSSPQMMEIWKKIGRVATSDETVLIEGESGTGKELLARAIYTNSARNHRPFLAVNCAAMPENLLESDLFGHEKGAFTDAQTRRIGKFEQCNGGTLFLDEISEMSLLNQSKLLRVLENKSFQRVGGNEEIHTDIRIVAAANRNLQEEVNRGRFRLDLFYRLQVVSFHIPPLRERQEDIPLLIDLFVRQNAIKYGKKNLRVTPETVNFLSSLHWKGNIRELKNAISAAVVFTTGEVLQPDDFTQLKQDNYRQAFGDRNKLDHFRECVKTAFHELCCNRPGAIFQLLSSKLETHLVDLAMEHCNNNQVAAAKLLGISRNTLRKRLDCSGDTVQDAT